MTSSWLWCHTSQRALTYFFMFASLRRTDSQQTVRNEIIPIQKPKDVTCHIDSLCSRRLSNSTRQQQSPVFTGSGHVHFRYGRCRWLDSCHLRLDQHVVLLLLLSIWDPSPGQNWWETDVVHGATCRTGDLILAGDPVTRDVNSESNNCNVIIIPRRWTLTPVKLRVTVSLPEV